jgi:hypothetical protein
LNTTQAGLFVGLLSIGCTSIEAVCPITPFPAIEVEVRYAATEEPAWWGTRGIVQDGNFVDSLFATSEFAEDSSTAFLLAAAFDRPGTYDVTVERTGFKTVQMDGVTATVDAQCSQVVPVRLQVRLEPEPE